MPLTLGDLSGLSITKILEILPQLAQIDLGYFDRNYVLQALNDPNWHKVGNRSRILRDLVFRHRHRLELPPPPAPLPKPASGRVYELYQSWSMEGVVAPQRTNTARNWELAFLAQMEEEPAPPVPFLAEDTEKEPRLSATDTLSLKEIASQIPPGMLGLQLDYRKQPFNLVFSAEKENDPRKNLLKGKGWFEVRNATAAKGVLWAAATLENYNILEEAGLTYDLSPKVKQWYEYVISDAPLPGRNYFAEDNPLFYFQKDAVNFLVRRKRAMLALSPGLGKTLVSAYAASQIEEVRNILLVCPASLLRYWYNELRKWTYCLALKPQVEIWHRQTGAVPKGEFLPADSQFWAITNPETLTRHLDEFQFDEKQRPIDWDMVIMDESIMYKHRQSKRAKAASSIAKGVPYVWLLTGAPATRYLDDMWHQFYILNNRGYGSYWRFADRYCAVEDNVFAKSVFANKFGAEDEIKANYRDVYFARSQDQVMNIPDWLMEDIDIAMTLEQEEIYATLQEELLLTIGEGEDMQEVPIGNRLVLMLRSIQVASNPVLVGAANTSGKWAAIPELMEIYPGPYLLWVNYIRSGQMLQEAMVKKFGVNRVALANGSTPMEERTRLVDLMQADGLDVLVLNNQVGKFGFTLTKARTSIFVERGYDDSYFQCLHRNRRIGTTQSPIIVNLRSVTEDGDRTIDHVVHDSLDYRNGMIRKITLGDLRGLKTK